MAKSPSRFHAPLQIVLMFAIIIATILLGFYMFPSSEEERERLLSELGTTNQGEFLKPAMDIAGLDFAAADGSPWTPQGAKPKWRLFIVAGEQCQSSCRELLYLSRQVHIRLGKNSHRFERVLLVTGPFPAGEFAATLEREHPYLKVLKTDQGALEQWLGETNSEWTPANAEALLVDPAGIAMMRYDESHGGTELLEDLDHLLKYSHE